MCRENRDRRRQSWNTPGHAHELTFSCYRRFPFFKAQRCRQWLLTAIDAARIKLAFDLWAFVIMPEHVHLIVRPRRPDYAMSSILSAIKRPVGQRAIAYLVERQSPWLHALTRLRRGSTERLFWQSGGGYDRNIISGRTLLQMIDYVHENPVRRQLVQRASDWEWSSASHYVGGKSCLAIDPIPAEWLLDG
jgi:putative transposase